MNNPKPSAILGKRLRSKTKMKKLKKYPNQQQKNHTRQVNINTGNYTKSKFNYTNYMLLII